MTKFMLMLLAAAAAWAQMPGPQPPTPAIPDLAGYLGLSPAQMVQIADANAAYAMFVAGKSRRVVQVNQEIAELTTASPLDPMGLGLRYAELEEIRREIRDEEGKTHDRVLAILNDAQKAKLKTLEDAMKLQPLVCQAQAVRLIDVQPFPGNVIPAARITPILLGLPACPQPVFVSGPIGQPIP